MHFFSMIRQCTKYIKMKGEFDFIYQLPQILYSFMISTIIKILLELLALSQGNITDFKDNKKRKMLTKERRNYDLNLKLN